MNGLVVAANPGAQGFDTDTPLTATACAGLAAAGMTFAIRYVGFSQQHSTGGDLTVAEVNAILSSGMALMVVQHARFAGWQPSAALGAADGAVAAQHAASLGVGRGTCIWCDLEGISGSAEDTIVHANAWTDAVIAGGYDPGVYVGSGVPLSSMQWYKSLKVRRYWKALNDPTDVAIRGFQMVQSAGGQVAGVNIDRNLIQADQKGDVPRWFAPAPVA
jgi:hypothetical protein